MKGTKIILPIIIISQFFCTSLWFAGNGVIGDLMIDFELLPRTLEDITSSVQFGFILGSLIFAILTISDRFSPSNVFLCSALLASLFNIGIIWEGNNLFSILTLRFLTGFFLAGIYPVGMKIAADHYEKGLGKSLGFLVGALVIGTAFPHLAKDMTHAFPWKSVFVVTSILSLLGGLLMRLCVPDGPFRKMGRKLELSAFIKVFKNREFRSAAFGYFGHMWELYAFWVFVPVILATYAIQHPNTSFNIPLMSFSIIGIGSLACVISGYAAQRFGTKYTAKVLLFLSGMCCIVSPIMFTVASEFLFVGFLLFWGMVVIADSPLFSTLVAQNVQAEMKGTALTLVSCIGFSLTIVSIQLLGFLNDSVNPTYIYTALAFGPLIGLIALHQRKKNPSSN